MRRLNAVEYQNTTSDLFGALPNGVNFPEDAREDGFDTLDTALSVSRVHVDAWMGAAEVIVDQILGADPGGVTAGWCDYATADQAANIACGTLVVQQFANLAWRRSLSDWTDEDPIAPYRAIIEASGEHERLAAQGVDMRVWTALNSILLSPRFVHRVELADADGNLDSPSLASRLSYFLWSSAPDSALLASDLTNYETIAAEAVRLQADPRFDRFEERFPDLWLHLEKLDSAAVDTTVYPAFTEELGQKMFQETMNFVRGFISDPNLPVPQLLTTGSNTTDADLLALYGDSPRGGLATQAAILTLTGAGNRTSPVRRGMWVMESLLCDPPPPPPEDVIAEVVAELGDIDPDMNQRERLAIHRERPGCLGCHVTMDTIGIGFENYDAIGAYRTSYPNGEAVDPSGVLPGVEAPFGTASELLTLLAEDERIPDCVVEKLYAYGAGRRLGSADAALVDVVARASGGAEMSFADAIGGIVTSDAFLRRDEKTEADY